MERIGQVNQHCIIEVTKQKKDTVEPLNLRRRKTSTQVHWYQEIFVEREDVVKGETIGEPSILIWPPAPPSGSTQLLPLQSPKGLGVFVGCL